MRFLNHFLILREGRLAGAKRGSISDCCLFFRILANCLRAVEDVAFFDAEPFHPGFERRRFDVEDFGGTARAANSSVGLPQNAQNMFAFVVGERRVKAV